MITNYDKIFLQITPANLLQITTILLQTATAITNCDKFITNYNSYCKLRQLLQITEYTLPKEDLKIHISRVTPPDFC